MKVDTRQIEAELKKLEDNYIQEKIDACVKILREGLKVAHQHQGVAWSPKVYKHHTHNLANAPGFCIVIDGKIVVMEIYGEKTHPEAKKNTEAYLIYAEKAKYGVYIADGMFYASFVSSKGFDVLDSAILYIENKLKNQ